MRGDRANTTGTVISDCMMEGRGQEGASQKSTGRPHLFKKKKKKNVKDKPSLLHCVHSSEVVQSAAAGIFCSWTKVEKRKVDLTFFF